MVPYNGCATSVVLETVLCKHPRANIDATMCRANGVTTWVWTCGNARGNNIWKLGLGVAKLKPHIAGT